MGIAESKSRVFTPDEKAALDHARKTKQKTDGRYEIAPLGGKANQVSMTIMGWRCQD